ncbi:hypothetical protein HG537_0A02110 [Torulaspora globosa]|uniref:C2H2-type domain-containing protein n=1 Tax=Torulaspora globosa TaxID=48254 RepID=A0A7H9HJ77_9SACH|nr:hypothetical protein HG537_0A02110 [Torulaspora sp. CBS 2947]
MSDVYGHIADIDSDEGDQGNEKDEERGFHLDMSGFSEVGIEKRQNESFIETYLVSSDGQMLCEPQISVGRESEVLFSPSSSSSQRNPVTPTLKVEESEGVTWANLMGASREDAGDGGSSVNVAGRSYLGAFSADHELNDAYRSDAETGYASSNYHTPGLYPVDPAVSPAVSYLTIGDDELDDLLSVHSGTSAYTNFSLPMSDSGFRHVTNVDELDNLLSASSGRFDENFSEFIQSSVTACEEQQGSRVPPVISVQEFQEKHSDGAEASVSSTFDEQNFQKAEQKLNASLLCPADADMQHEDMINGRIARRRASHGSRRSSRSPRRSRSLSPDERARSLSEDSDRLLLLADLQPPSPNESSNRSPSPLRDGETLQNLSGNTRRRLSQKNPATYACDLCDKKFTRPYNLKSHLRTHTNERPFICSSCGKAFARQHDRKRHEDLHTGKKRYVCGGKLKDGSPWGCGKKFARSDALGRHFKTESGKKCITPLYQEAARNNQILDPEFQQD